MTKEVNEKELTVAERARLAMQTANEAATLENVKEERAQETKSFVRIETIKVEKGKSYNLRLLPNKPSEDGTVRASFSYPIHTRWLSVHTDTGKRRSVIVVKPSYAGITGADPLEVFNKQARRIAHETKDEELTKYLDHFQTSLDYKFEEVAYVIDNDNREAGIQLYQMSFTQHKDIHDLRVSLWEQLRAEQPDAMCPFTNPNGAYRLIVNRSMNNKYTFTQSPLSNDKLTDGEIEAWFSTPSIPESQYRYNRYMLTGMIAALEQIEADFDLDITSTDEFRDAVANIESQLDENDTSVFQTGDENDNGDDSSDGDGKVQLNELFDESDRIADEGLENDSEDAANLRTSISKFITQEELDVKISVRKSNDDLLFEVKEAVEAKAKADAKPTARRRRR